MDSVSPRELSTDSGRVSLSPLSSARASLPPLLLSPPLSPRSSEPGSMPPTTVCENGDATSTNCHLPSAVEHAPFEPRSGSVTHTHESKVQRLQFASESQRLGTHETLSDGDGDGNSCSRSISDPDRLVTSCKHDTVGDERQQGASDSRLTASTNVIDISSDAGSSADIAVSDQKLTPTVVADARVWSSRKQLTVQTDVPIESPLLLSTAAATSTPSEPPSPLLRQLRHDQRDSDNVAASASSVRPYPSAAATQKRTSYIGARTPTAKTSTLHINSNEDDSDGSAATDFGFGFKRSNLQSAGDQSPSFSRSLKRLLSSTGATSPRIYPVAYGPDRCADDDERNGDNDADDNDEDTSSHKTAGPPRSALSPKYVSRRSVESRSSTGRLEPSAVVVPHTVQVASAPQPAAGRATAFATIEQHRAVFLRTQKTISDIFGQPQEAIWAKRLNRIMFGLIMLNFAVMALETCEGRNFAGADPAFPYLPTEQTYKLVDTVLGAIFSLELLSRVATARFSRAVLLDPFTVADFVALVPWFVQLVLSATRVTFSIDTMDSRAHAFVLVRLVRAVRLGNVLRQHDQSRILYLSIRASLRPLGITMFFLFTLIMLLATALFYAEPCYNVRTCQFTDIFNAAYFIMVTVATVGYGNQVPTLTNWASVSITGVAMICGQMYFAMPVFIIGNNFQNMYENFQWVHRRKQRQLDETLRPFDAQELHAHVEQLTSTQFHLLAAWRAVQLAVQKLVRASKATDADTTSAAAAQTQRLAKIQDVTQQLLSVHSEASELLQLFVPHKKKAVTNRSDAVTRSDGVLSNMYVRARRAMALTKQKTFKPTSVNSRDARAMAATARGRLWLLLEVPDSSPLAMAINRLMVGFALLSVLLFCCESLPELSSTGVDTVACRRVVLDYCTKTGFVGSGLASGRPDPGCFVRDEASGAPDWTQRLDFACGHAQDAPNCYGYGTNFGSLAPAMPRCSDVFDAMGASLICDRQQCNTAVATLVDMGPYWLYLEWMFGITFSLELALRFVASQDRAALVRDLYIVFDILSVLPFIVEVMQYLVQGVEPNYAIVATAPSFLSVIRVIKTTRILKLTRHFKGTKVLASTAKTVWKQLTIPIFFLFTGCIIAGAIFYEIERGTECFVGSECLWWGKNVLTPKFAAGLPDGKRVLIQDTRKVTLTDMLRSTWLSYTTLTAVGYGDLVPRTSIGKAFCISVVIISTIYSAMPVSLVGSKFYELYEKHMETMVVKRGGSSTSWLGTKRVLRPTDPVTGQPLNTTLSARAIELFALSESDLAALQQFVAMKRTLTNLQRNLNNFSSVGIDILQQRKRSSVEHGDDRLPSTLLLRNTDSLEQSIEQKTNAITDTLLQFSLVIEKLQDAPPTYEALADDPLHSLVVGKVYSAFKRRV